MNPANDPSLRVLIESAYLPSDRYTRAMEQQIRDLVALCTRQTDRIDREMRRADIAWQACFICALLFLVALIYIGMKWWPV